jgi:hypothetical protein
MVDCGTRRQVLLEGTAAMATNDSRIGVPSWFFEHYSLFVEALVECFEQDGCRCKECDFQTKDRRSMARHYTKHMDKNLPCTVCGIKVGHDINLLVHKKRYHPPSLN